MKNIDKDFINTKQIKLRENYLTSKLTHDINASDDEAEDLNFLNKYIMNNSAVKQLNKDDYNFTANI